MLLCAFLLLLPIKWIFAWVMATIFHELCHLICLWMLKVPVYGMRFTAAGAEIQTGSTTSVQEFLAAAAGPLGGLTLVLLLRHFPRLALCGLFQSLYNLLPLYPLDGGRMLRCVLPTKYADAVQKGIRVLVLLGLGLTAIWLWKKYSMGPLPLIFVLFVGIKTGKVTFPCKQTLHGLQ